MREELVEAVLCVVEKIRRAGGDLRMIARAVGTGLGALLGGSCMIGGGGVPWWRVERSMELFQQPFVDVSDEGKEDPQMIG